MKQFRIDKLLRLKMKYVFKGLYDFLFNNNRTTNLSPQRYIIMLFTTKLTAVYKKVLIILCNKKFPKYGRNMFYNNAENM